MSGDIFYSEVNPAVQKELNARGLSGKRRQTEDLNFMLGKIANIEVQAYGKPGKPKGIGNFIKLNESILNGARVRSGEYLPGGPDGFLQDRKYTQATSLSNDEIEYRWPTNKTKRIPPFVTSVDVNVTDHSIGLLNSCTFNITVPNPEMDLEYIESVYCRPGRPVDVTIEYPESAVVSGISILPQDELPSLTALQQQDTSAETETQKLNKVRFQGLILNFSIDYQTDMTAVVNVVLRGTTNVFTDVTAIVDSGKSNETTTKPTETETVGNITLFDGLRDEFNSKIDKTKESATHTPTDDYPMGLAYQVEYNINGMTHYGLTGRMNSNSSIIEKFISLGWLISFINRKILSKIETALPIKPEILFDINMVTTSIREYANLDYTTIASSHPDEIHLPDSSTLTKKELVTTYDISDGDLDSVIPFASNQYYTLQILPQDPSASGVNWRPGNEIKGPDAGLKNILINLNTIESVYLAIQNTTTGTVKLKEFLSVIFEKIKAATGTFIDLKLITHPSDNTKLMIYNVAQKPSGTGTTSDTVTPYSVPMFANHPYGTVITDFKFSGKLPTNAANLAFAINDFDSDTTSSDIAPFLNFMYSVNDVSRFRSTEEDGTVSGRLFESIDSAITIDDINDQFLEKYTLAYAEWRQARLEYGKNPNTTGNTDMHNALIKYISYVGKNIQQQYRIKTPIIPFEVEFTINGINGFKYGDILTFDGLPSRYKRNTVFSIISITHTVTDSGDWKTNIRCLTRAKID